MDDWGPQFKSLMSSALGQELERTLRERAELLAADARNASDMQSSYGLLKESAGVIKALEHLQFRAVTPKDEGSKVKN